MADPTTITCSASCTVTVVHELSLAPLQLDTADAAQIALAVIGVWAVGWAFRMLVRTLGTADKAVESDG